MLAIRSVQLVQVPTVLQIAVRWEDTELQADLTMGNLASALTLQSEEAALIAELRAGLGGGFCLADRALSPADLLAAGAHRA